MAAGRIRKDAPLFADVQQEGPVGGGVPHAPAVVEQKQEQHPTRTVRGFNQRWAARHGAGGAPKGGARGCPV